MPSEYVKIHPHAPNETRQSYTQRLHEIAHANGDHYSIATWGRHMRIIYGHAITPSQRIDKIYELFEQYPRSDSEYIGPYVARIRNILAARGIKASQDTAHRRYLRYREKDITIRKNNNNNTSIAKSQEQIYWETQMKRSEYPELKEFYQKMLQNI